MTAFLATFRLIISLLPMTVQAIQQVEQIAPAAGLGTQKLDLVKGLVADAAAGAPGLEATIEQIAKAVEAIASRMVAFLNAIGVFKKSA